MHFLIATTNAGKVSEFRQMLGTGRFSWMSLSDLPPLPEVEETGHTFRANAILKARSYARATSLWTMADDSGLEVDALGCSPGIFSARWAKLHDAGSGDRANNTLLLEQLKDVPASKAQNDDPAISRSPRSARFVCVLAVSDPHGRIMLTTRATMEGRIGLAPVGVNGFGYDPLFIVDGTDRTSAQMLPDEKHRISHRGRALEKMKQLLQGIQF